MTGLIPLRQRFIAGISTRTVSARTLHEFLGVRRDFTTWIRARIKQYGFEENQDYIVCSPKRGSKTRGGHNLRDYYLTLDMAKELAMVERTEKGKQARRYFIECERQLIEQKTQPQPPATQLPGYIRLLTVIENGKITHTQPLPDDAFIATLDKLPGMIPDLMPGKVLVDRKTLRNLGTNTAIAAETANRALCDIETLEQQHGINLYYRGKES